MGREREKEKSIIAAAINQAIFNFINSLVEILNTMFKLKSISNH